MLFYKIILFSKILYISRNSEIFLYSIYYNVPNEIGISSKLSNIVFLCINYLEEKKL